MHRISSAAVRTLLALAALVATPLATPLAAPLLGLAAAPAAAAQPDGARSEQTEDDLNFARRLSRAFQHAAEQIGPSVVHISADARQRVIERDIFGRRLGVREGPLVQSGLGSGVIVSPEGYIITNNHVVERAEALRVRLNDGREVEARIVGADPATDIAVLKIDAPNLTPARFGDSEALQVGEWVVAVGSPFGFDKSVTTGIVSAKGRTGLGGAETNRYEEFIQTDASINPGNSGGPLVNLEGEVIGINTAILSSRVGGSIGIGFAIPSRMAEAVYGAITTSGRVQRGWLGVMMQDLTPEAAAQAGLAQPRGVLIVEVVEGGPADRAGIQEGDVVTAIDGAPTGNTNRLRNAVAFTAPGSTVEITMVRGGETRTATARLMDIVEGRAIAQGATYLRDIGVSLLPLEPSLNARIGLARSARGLLVLEVVEGAPARDSGLQRGDIILAAGGDEVDEVDDLQRTLRQDATAVELILERDGRRGRLPLRLAQ